MSAHLEALSMEKRTREAHIASLAADSARDAKQRGCNLMCSRKLIVMFDSAVSSSCRRKFEACKVQEIYETVLALVQAVGAADPGPVPAGCHPAQ